MFVPRYKTLAARPRVIAGVFAFISLIGMFPGGLLIKMLTNPAAKPVAVLPIAFIVWGLSHVPFYVARAVGRARRSAPLLWSSTLVYNCILGMFALTVALASFNIVALIGAGWFALLTKLAASALTHETERESVRERRNHGTVRPARGR